MGDSFVLFGAFGRAESLQYTNSDQSKASQSPKGLSCW